MTVPFQWSEAHASELRDGAAAMGIELPAGATDLFGRYAEALEATNRVLNLTRVSPDQYVSLHFLDSLALLAAAPPRPGAALIDVGTGAGFPGLALAIARPDLRVVLLDSTVKKLRFLDEVIAALGLTGVSTLHARAEEAARQPSLARQFDVAAARAVARLDRLAGWLLPFVKPGGIAVAYKSSEVEQEIEEGAAALVRAGARVKQTAEVVLPGTDIHRKLVILTPRR